MKNFKSIFLVVIFVLVGMSCSENDNPVVQPVEAKKISNLPAPAEGRGRYTGDFAKFSFKEGKLVTGDNWDIAFRATEIIVNGGVKGKVLEDIDRTGNAKIALVKNISFGNLTTAPENSSFKQDASDLLAISTGSGNGWYTYVGPPSHAIIPIKGTNLVIKTIDGNYAKMEILSYYKDAPKESDITISSEGRYYTFNYVYNPIVGDKNFK